MKNGKTATRYSQKQPFSLYAAPLRWRKKKNTRKIILGEALSRVSHSPVNLSYRQRGESKRRAQHPCTAKKHRHHPSHSHDFRYVRLIMMGEIGAAIHPGRCVIQQLWRNLREEIGAADNAGGMYVIRYWRY